MPTGMPSGDDDGFVRPQYRDDKTGKNPGTGGDRTKPSVSQNSPTSDGYVNPYMGDKGDKKSPPGGAKNNDGYNNGGIDSDGPVGMGKTGFGKDRKGYGDKSGPAKQGGQYKS